jgi:hypothetical protein
MLGAAENCTISKQHDMPWEPSLSKATHAIWYWTRRTARNDIRHIDDRVLYHFLEYSDVDASYFDRTMTVKECASDLRNSKAKLKDVLDEATSNVDIYEIEVATARVERRYPHLVKDNVMQAQEQEEQIKKEVKQRETRRATHKSFQKLVYQIRGHLKRNSTKNRFLIDWMFKRRTASGDKLSVRFMWRNTSLKEMWNNFHMQVQLPLGIPHWVEN